MFLVDHEGKARGTVPIAEALRLAQEAELDLVEVSPNVRPPIAKILDFGKYKYDQTKAQAKAKKKHKEGTLKEIRLGIKIDDHDFEVKAKKASKFIAEGNKVKATVVFRGREIVHPELGTELLQRFIDSFDGIAKIEQAPLKQGRSISTVLSPK